MWTCQLNHYKLRPPAWWDLGKPLTAQPTCRLWLSTMCLSCLQCQLLFTFALLCIMCVIIISFPPAFRNVLLFLEKFVKTVCVKVTFVNPHPSPYIIYKLLLSLSFLYCEFAKVYEILKNVRLHVHT